MSCIILLYKNIPLSQCVLYISLGEASRMLLYIYAHMHLFFSAGVLPAAQGMLAHVSHASLGTRSARLFCLQGLHWHIVQSVCTQVCINLLFPFDANA